MRRIIFDVEANGLIGHATHLWCAVAYDLDTEETFVFSDWTKEYEVNGGTKDFLNFLDTCEFAAIHNGISYDFSLLDNLFGYKFKGEVFDTLLASKLLQFNRKTPKGCRTNHGLEAYGVRLGIAKPKQEQWTVFEENMLYRCIEDVKINIAVYHQMVKELEAQPDSKQALDIEHKVAFITAAQVKKGWLLDLQKAQDNITYLDKEIERLRLKLEPLIPMRCAPKDHAATWEEVNSVLKIWDSVPTTRLDHRGRPIKPSRVPKIPRILKDGRYDKHTAMWFGLEQEDAWASRDIAGPYSRIEYKKVKLTQHKHVKDFLLSIGWQPTSWNYKRDERGAFIRDHERRLIQASPKLTVDSFDSIPGTFGEDFKLWATLTNRRTTIQNPKNDTKGWINLRREDGTVSCDPDILGAATGRMVHRGIVNVPGVKSIFGKEMRQCWIAEEGRSLIGADAAGAQLRLLAAAMGDKDYLETVVDGAEETDAGLYLGTDVHTQNGIAAGLINPKDVEYCRLNDGKNNDSTFTKTRKRVANGRARSKTFIYCLLFGGGDAKLGAIVGGKAKEGKQLKSKFFAGFPKLKALLRNLEAEWVGNKKAYGTGFIQGLDGRRVIVDSQHKLLNYKLQGDEAIFIKYTMVLVDRLLKKNNVDANLLLVMHDEMNYSINPIDIDKAKQILIHSFIKAGEYLGLICKMETTPLTGDNWAEIH